MGIGLYVHSLILGGHCFLGSLLLRWPSLAVGWDTVFTSCLTHLGLPQSQAYPHTGHRIHDICFQLRLLVLTQWTWPLSPSPACPQARLLVHVPLSVGEMGCST